MLGAGLKNLAVNVTKQYVVLFTVALTIGAPVTYVLMEALLDLAYTNHMPMNYSGIAVSVAILIFVLLATVSTLVGKVIKSNPVNGLKVE